jgi:glycosyltransferase involved in cell wall biosynthesis
MKILYIERKPNEFVSIEKVFRQVAESMATRFRTEFQQVPFGPKVLDTIRNLVFFRRKNGDVYHITGHINYIALRLPPKHTVLTIHDLRFLSSGGRIRRYILKKLYLDLPVRRLKYITAVSEATKQAIISNTKCDPEKVRVIENPLRNGLAATQPKEFNKQSPVLLQVGTMQNKNIERLAAALRGVSCKLRIVGRVSETQRTNLIDNGIEFESICELTDEEMSREYENADIVVFCSTYEGFGLPIIEGQAAGRPIVTSDLSPLIETSGEAACLVDPFDPESIKNGILRVVNDDEFRNRLVRSGFRNAERFDPERIAKKYEDLYIEVLGNR